MLPLGRIASQLRELRWTQVFVELALLIAGILIALAVDGWLEDRRDARLEHEYLERLVRDLDQDLAILDEFQAFEQRQAESASLAYRTLRGLESGDPEVVSTALSRLFTRRTLRLVRATYTDLVGTGNLRLVRDAAVRDGIVSLYEQGDRLAAVIDRNNLVFVDQMYMQTVLAGGLVAPRAGSNLPTIEEAVRPLFERLGVAPDVSQDRIWTLPVGDAERTNLANKVLMRAIVSQQATVQAAEHRGRVIALRERIMAVAARQPGA